MPSSSVQYRRSISREIELADNIFGIEINKALLHQVVRMQLNNKRQGTQSAKTVLRLEEASKTLETKRYRACPSW